MWIKNLKQTLKHASHRASWISFSSREAQSIITNYSRYVEELFCCCDYAIDHCLEAVYLERLLRVVMNCVLNILLSSWITSFWILFWGEFYKNFNYLRNVKNKSLKKNCIKKLRHSAVDNIMNPIIINYQFTSKD